MSRYEIEARDSARHQVIVGWDNPLRTYFFQVHDAEAVYRNKAIEKAMAGHMAGDEAWNRMSAMLEDNTELCWRGSTVGEITSVVTLAELVSAYAILPADVATQLAQEQRDAPPLTEMQEKIAGFIQNASAIQKAHDPAEGDLCPSCGEGRLAFTKVENCTCHIAPPCPECVEVTLFCPSCHYRPHEWAEEGEK